MRLSTSKLSRAFSLVEVVMSIGVVALAFVPILGLLPASLRTFRESMNVAIGSQIAQKILNEAIQTDFNTLIHNDELNRDSSGDVTPANYTFCEPWRYFDEQGNELSPETRGQSVYHVLTRINPQVPLPSIGSNQDLRNLAQITVQVVTNPGNAAVPVVKQPDGATASQATPLRNLVDPSARFPVYTAVALVPRNE